MLVSLGRRRRGLHGMADALEDALTGSDSDGLVTKPPQATPGYAQTPTWASSSTSAGPVTPTQGNNSQSWSWGDIGRQLVAGVVQGVASPFASAARKPAPPPSSGIPTGVIVAGVAGVGLLAFVLLRRRPA